MDSQVIRRAKLHSVNSKGKWIQEVVESPKFKKGAFTKKARAAGYKTTEFMRKVIEHPDDFDETTRRQAQFMKTLISINSKR
jgi:hypothetical protein